MAEKEPTSKEREPQRPTGKPEMQSRDEEKERREKALKEVREEYITERRRLEQERDRLLELFKKQQEEGGVKKAKEGVEALGEEAFKAATKIAEMNLSFNELIYKVRTGAISFDQLESSIDRLAATIEDDAENINSTWEKIKQVLGTAAEESKTTVAIMEVQKKLFKELPLKLDQFYKNLEKLNLAAAAAGGEGAMERRGWPPEFKKIPEKEEEWSEEQWSKWMDETRKTFNARIVALEVQDKHFGESWRDTWPMESLLACLYVEAGKKPRLRKFQEELRTTYEDRRRVHDYFWAYQRASGVERILEVSSTIQKSVIERMVREEGVGQAMYEIQKKLEQWDLANKASKGSETTQEKYKNTYGLKHWSEKKLKDVGEKIWNLEKDRVNEEIRAFGQGLVLEIEIDEKEERREKERFIVDKEGKRIEIEDTKIRIAARMMVILGLCAQYGNTGLGQSGDFFIGRLLNLRDHISDTGKGERWQYRDKIVAGFRQHLYFSGPLAAHWGLTEEKKAKNYGIKIIREPIEGTKDKRLLVKICGQNEDVEIEEKDGTKKKVHVEDGIELLKKFKIEKEPSEYWLGGGKFADQAFKADKGRVGFRNTGNFLDTPTEKNFYDLLVKDFEHLSGSERWQFFSHLVGGIIEFYRDEGWVIARLLKGKLTTTFKYKDEEGKEKRFFTFAYSDAMRVGIREAWDSSDIDGFIRRLQVLAPQTLGPLGECLKREKIKFLGIPGIGPIRGVREIWDTVKKNWFLALLAMLMEIVTASLPEELELGGKKKR